MPNYKLGSTIRNIINYEARAQSTKRNTHITAPSCPLTTAQIQSHIMPAEAVSLLRQLTFGGVQNLPSHKAINVALRSAYLPGLTHDVCVHLQLPETVFVPRNSYYGRQHNSTDVLTFDAGEPLDDETRDALTAWGNKIVREKRLEELAGETVDAVLGQCQSTADIAVRWPFLMTLVPERYASDARDCKLWRGRFRAVPKDLRRYAHEFGPLMQRKMVAAEVYLTSASMLGDYTHAEGTIRANVQDYNKVPN